MIRKIIDFWKGLFEDMAHGYSYDKQGQRLDLDEWEGCPHGVIEGRCEKCYANYNRS